MGKLKNIFKGIGSVLDLFPNSRMTITNTFNQDWDKKEVTDEKVIADIKIGIALYKYNNMGTSFLTDEEKLILQAAGYWKEK